MERPQLLAVFANHRIDKDSPVALYYQIKEEIKESIASGDIPPGVALPSELKLCELYGVSRPTIRQATQELLSEGLLERRRGVGTYVAQPKIRQRLGSMLGFTERMRAEGRRPSTWLLEHRILPASEAGPGVEAALGVSAGARILRLVRLRLADEQPLVLETVHLPLDRFEGLESVDLATGSLYRTLEEQYGVEIRYLRETLEPVLPTPSEAKLLQTDTNSPAMLAHLTTYDQSGAPVEHTHSLVRGDRCQYYIEFSPSDEPNGGTVHLRQTQLEILR